MRQAKTVMCGYVRGYLRNNTSSARSTRRGINRTGRKLWRSNFSRQPGLLPSAVDVHRKHHRTDELKVHQHKPTSAGQRRIWRCTTAICIESRRTLPSRTLVSLYHLKCCKRSCASLLPKLLGVC